MDAYTHPFLEALAETGVVASACRIAGVSSATVYNRRRTDADFAAMWDNALEDATDAMEQEARRRAMYGHNEPVIHKGEMTPVWERDEDGELVMAEYGTGSFYPKGHEREGEEIMGHRPRQARNPDGSLQWLTVRKVSDPLLMFLLKGNRKKFSTDSVEVSGPGGSPIAMDTTTRAARTAALLAIAAKRQAADNNDLL